MLLVELYIFRECGITISATSIIHNVNYCACAAAGKRINSFRSSTTIFKSQVGCVSHPLNKTDLTTVKNLVLLHYTGGLLHFMMQISLCNLPVCFIPWLYEPWYKEKWS